MITVEQAIFTSAATAQQSGYHLVAASPGVTADDRQELTVWCPSHDSLAGAGPDAASFNFHPLPSGAFCLSRTTLSGMEYSGRGSGRVYTHCLIVAPEALARFANNPFALYRAAAASGGLPVRAQPCCELATLSIAGRASAVDQVLLARLANAPGPEWMGGLVQAAIDSPCLAIAGGPGVEHVIAGLVSCLPPECRTEFSFTTGLKFSINRPFRLVGYAGPASELTAYERRYNLTVLDLCQAMPEELLPIDGWARLIERTLATGRTTFLATQFSKRRFDLTVADLPALGLQLLESLDASSLRGEPVTRPAEQPSAPLESMATQHAHAAHCKFESQTAVARPVGPSHTLDPQSPAVLQKLEALDDAVFEAIGGKASALDDLKRLWPDVRGELGETLLGESREQYLRYALSIWDEYVASGRVRNPERAAQALDVLCVLFDQI